MSELHSSHPFLRSTRYQLYGTVDPTVHEVIAPANAAELPM